MSMSKDSFTRIYTIGAGGEITLPPTEDINDQDRYGRGMLTYLVMTGNLAIIEKIINLKANINIQDIYGRTPLIIAAQLNLVSTVKLLLKHKADTNLIDKEGNDALHIASHKLNIEVVKLLINKNSDIDNLMQSTIQTYSKLPYSLDRYNDFSEIMRIFINTAFTQNEAIIERLVNCLKDNIIEPKTEILYNNLLLRNSIKEEYKVFLEKKNKVTLYTPLIEEISSIVMQYEMSPNMYFLYNSFKEENLDLFNECFPEFYF